MNEAKRQYNARWRKENADRVKAYREAWRAANRDRLLAQQKEERAAARAALPPPPPYVPPLEKACTKCGVVKLLLDFEAHRQTRDGRNSWCRECANACKAKQRATRLATDPAFRESLAAQKRAARRAADPHLAERDALRAARADHHAHVDARQRHLADCRAHVQAWVEWRAVQPRPVRAKVARPAVYERAKSAFRRARRLGRLAPWCTIGSTLLVYQRAVELERITGVEWNVDHEIPLRAREVSGLHCAENLVVLPRVINEGKKNLVPDHLLQPTIHA